MESAGHRVLLGLGGGGQARRPRSKERVTRAGAASRASVPSSMDSIAARSVAPHLREGHVVVLESTTYPGTTREVALRKASGGFMP